MNSLHKRMMAALVVLLAMVLMAPSPGLARSEENPCPGNSCSAPGQLLTHGRSDFKGNLKTRQHIYYAGDSLEVSIKFSRGGNLLADGTAAAHIVVISPESAMFSVPVDSSVGTHERMFFNLVVTTETLPAGQYQVALIVTDPDGDPANLDDWYNGFRGLLDMEGIYISDEPMPEDRDADGECDFDADGDGFCDSQNLADDDDSADVD